jgi:hypothetical protein
MKTKNDRHVGRWSRQPSSNGHSEETQLGPVPHHPISESQMTQETTVINGSKGARKK